MQKVSKNSKIRKTGIHDQTITKQKQTKKEKRKMRKQGKSFT